MAKDTKVAALTVRLAVLLLPSKVAVITAVPLATALARPVDGATVLTLVVAEDQVDKAVTSRVEPSLYVAVATKAWVLFRGTVAAAGLTATEVTTGPLMGGVPRMGSCPPPPQAASTKLQSSAISQGKNPAGRFRVVMEITSWDF